MRPASAQLLRHTPNAIEDWLNLQQFSVISPPTKQLLVQGVQSRDGGGGGGGGGGGSGGALVLGEAVGEVDADTDAEAGEDADAATAWAPEGWYAPSEA